MASEPRGAWIIRAGRGSGNHEADFQDVGAVAIGFTGFGDLGGMTREQIREEAERVFADEPPATRSTHTYQLNAFVNEVRPGDIVLTPKVNRSKELLLGVIEGPYEHPVEPLFADWHHNHRTTWIRTIEEEDLPESVRTTLRTSRTITRIKDVESMERMLEGSAETVHLLLKWRLAEESRTIELHRDVAQEHGAVWWGKIGDPGGRAAMSADRLTRFRQQIQQGGATHVYLYRPGEVWRTDLLAITSDVVEVEEALVPPYYGATMTQHNLWVKIANFEQLPSWWPVQHLRPAGPRAAASPMETFLRSRGSVLYVQERDGTESGEDHCFILLQDARLERPYGDEEGLLYAFDSTVTGRVPLLTSGSGNFIYYRPGSARDGTAQTFFGSGRITTVDSRGTDGELERFAARLSDYKPFATPVPARDAAPRGWNHQHSIAEIRGADFDEIVRKGTGAPDHLYDMDWLAKETSWPRDRLEKLIQAIGSTQVVLAGPPGTGKTYIARCVLKYLTGGDRSRARTVQFHPSYGYEEFIEGLRPDWDEERDAMVFRPVPGVVLQMNAQARQDRTCYVLMDEMNRANLPEVLGELLFLFEYRDEAIQLRFGTTAHGESTLFELSPHLRFIGTMNTADRSIRSVDAAMRRRFELFHCPPDASVLHLWYEFPENENEVPDLVEGFERLNSSLVDAFDEHHTVGHSFFMDRRLTPRLLLDVWDRQIAPLLEEYFFDRPEVIDQFTCERFWPSAGV